MSRYDGLHLSGIEQGGSLRGGYEMFGMGRRYIRRRSLEGQLKSSKTRQYDRKEEESNLVGARARRVRMEGHTGRTLQPTNNTMTRFEMTINPNPTTTRTTIGRGSKVVFPSPLDPRH
jgi:hypothetical protein